MDERPAPVVTITDPTRPGDLVDVVAGGHERDPWRPGRRQLQVVALLAVLALAAAVPQQVVAARAADDRAATAAADAVRLSVQPADGVPDGGGVAVLVSNDGPGAVRLLDLRVDGPGYASQPVDQDLDHGDNVVVTVRDTRRCGEDLLEAGQAGQVRLRARTPGGREVSRAVVLAPDVWGALVVAAQQRCGDLAPEQALRAVVTAVTTGRTVGLHLELENRGHVPLWLAYAGVPVPGLSPVPSRQMPLVLAVAPGRVVALDVRVGAQDCSPELWSSADEVALDLAVTPLLAGGRAGTQVDVHVVSARAAAALRDLVAARCGTGPAVG